MYLKTLDQFPTEKAWALIEIKRIRIPAEGVWAPGHGYPEHDELSPEIQIFDNEDEWMAKIRSYADLQHGRTRDFRAFIIEPVEIEFTVSTRVL